jgi:hypothetical protein
MRIPGVQGRGDLHNSNCTRNNFCIIGFSILIKSNRHTYKNKKLKKLKKKKKRKRKKATDIEERKMSSIKIFHLEYRCMELF